MQVQINVFSSSQAKNVVKLIEVFCKDITVENCTGDEYPNIEPEVYVRGTIVKEASEKISLMAQGIRNTETAIGSLLEDLFDDYDTEVGTSYSVSHNCSDGCYYYFIKPSWFDEDIQATDPDSLFYYWVEYMLDPEDIELLYQKGILIKEEN